MRKACVPLLSLSFALILLDNSAVAQGSGATFLPVNIASDTDQFGNLDGRGSLTERAAQLGLADAEVARIRNSSGYVICPGTTHRNTGIMSAELVGSNQVIATALHAFFDEAGVGREPLSDCYFRTQAESPQKETGDHPANPTINMPSRTILAVGQKPIEVVGPFPEIEDELLTQHRTFWRR